MTKLSKYSWVGVGVALLFSAALVWMMLAAPKGAQANPSETPSFKGNTAASTTLAYMTPGTGTSTITYDSNAGTKTKFDSVNLAYQLTATSTGVAVPTVILRLEDSRDGVDWYPRNVVSLTATTSQATSDPYNSISLRVASSTTAVGGSGTATRIHGSISVDSPMRYVRAIFYSPTGGGNYGLYAEMIPVKEKQ